MYRVWDTWKLYDLSLKISRVDVTLSISMKGDTRIKSKVYSGWAKLYSFFGKCFYFLFQILDCNSHL